MGVIMWARIQHGSADIALLLSVVASAIEKWEPDPDTPEIWTQLADTGETWQDDPDTSTSWSVISPPILNEAA